MTDVNHTYTQAILITINNIAKNNGTLMHATTFPRIKEVQAGKSVNASCIVMRTKIMNKQLEIQKKILKLL